MKFFKDIYLRYLYLNPFLQIVLLFFIGLIPALYIFFWHIDNKRLVLNMKISEYIAYDKKIMEYKQASEILPKLNKDLKSKKQHLKNINKNIINKFQINNVLSYLSLFSNKKDIIIEKFQTDISLMDQTSPLKYYEMLPVSVKLIGQFKNIIWVINEILNLDIPLKLQIFNLSSELSNKYNFNSQTKTLINVDIIFILYKQNINENS